jgi:hypothetical protein
MSTFSEELKERTMAFAESVLRLVDKLPHTPAGRVIGQSAGSICDISPVKLSRKLQCTVTARIHSEAWRSR